MAPFPSLLLPVSESSPGGIESRETEEYIALITEMDKLTNLSGSGQPNWREVERLGAEILVGSSKDFMVAAWLSAAWLETLGIDGFANGLGLFSGLIKDFWGSAFPGLKRLRGRRNALGWWLDRSRAWLDGLVLAPITQELSETLIAALTAIDQDLGELDPEAPSIRDLLQRVRQFDVIQPVAEPSPLVEESATEQATGNTADSASSKTASVSAVTSASSTLVAAQRPPAAAMGGVGVLSDLGGVASVEDLFGALGPVFSFLDSASEVLGQLDASHPMAITLRRLGARGRISSSPPANGQKTYIPAPPFADQSSFDAILQSGNSDGILAFCESRISTYPFWFDLDCESAKAYSARGPSASHMREGIISALLEFLDRLPGVENLTFSDGQAFASDKTRAWIAACRESRSGGGGDRFSVLRKQAIDAVNEGQFETAVGLLHAYVDGSRSGREQFRARLALAEIALAEKRDFDPLPFVDPLVDEVERLKLPDWEPDLAVAAWTLKLRACRDAAVYYRKVGNFAKAEAVEAEVSVALKAVSVLDFGQALRQI